MYSTVQYSQYIICSFIFSKEKCVCVCVCLQEVIDALGFVITLFVVIVDGDLKYLDVWWYDLHILLPNSHIDSVRFHFCVLQFQDGDILRNSCMELSSLIWISITNVICILYLI